MSLSDFRRFSDKLPDAMLLLRADGLLVSANQAACQFFAIDAAEFTDAEFRQFTGLSQGELAQRIKPCVRSSQPVPLNIGLTAGKIIENRVQVKGFRFELTADEPAYVILRLEQLGPSKDKFFTLNAQVLEQKKVLHLLRESRQELANREAELSAILSNTSALIYIKDLEGRYRLVNKQFERLFKTSSEQLYGKTDRAVFPAGTARLMQENDRKVIESGRVREFEEHVSFPDGIHTYVSVKFPLFDHRGRIESICAISTDITERVQAEEAIEQFRLSQLHDANAFSRTLFEYSPIGLVLCDSDGLIVEANPAFVKIIGYGGDEVKLETLQGITPRAYKEQDQAQITMLKTSGRYGPYEKELVHRDGQHIPVRLSGRLLEREGKSYIWSSVEDISDRKEIEEALIEAKLAAESATEAKSSFLANMSHEIRTPMNAIIGLSHLALQTELSRKQQGYIQKVHDAAEGLLGIIDDILDFSKIEAGKLSLEMNAFNLLDCIDSVAGITGVRAEEKSIEVLFRIAEDVPNYLVGDPLRISQVLMNLVNNAVKFTAEGGEVLVTVEVGEEFDADIQLHFSVRDNGIGIPQDQIKNLFESFSQADVSTTRKFGGSGLGLAISKKLTTMMNGTIWAESILDEGSTFHFTCSLKKQKKQESLRDNLPVDIPALKILIVDDNATSRAILSEILSSFSFRVEEADSGHQAISMLENADGEEPFDLVLMDWYMPEMDGVETTRRIQSDTQITHPPAIMMVTAHALDAVKRVAHGVSFADYLHKPVFPSTLLGSVMHVMGHEIAFTTHEQENRELVKTALEKLRGATVLLVEDNQVNQELAVELISSYGIHVDVANHGMEAMQKIEQNDYDGILMDCQMPVMDGYEATRRIRKKTEWKSLPIIAMTANAMAGDREKVIQAGMNDHIAKPINVDNMLTTMAKWITASRPGEQMPGMENAIPPAAISPGGRDAFPELPGIDRQRVAHIYKGNSDLFLRISRKFVDNYRDFVAEFTRTMADDREAATRLVHSMKGLSGNIGAVQLQTCFIELEQACRKGDDTGNALSRVSAELQRVVDGIERQKGHGLDSKPETDLSGLTSLLTELRDNIQDNNLHSTELVDRLLTFDLEAEAMEQVEVIASSIYAYDFELAMVQLTTLLDKLGLELA